MIWICHCSLKMAMAEIPDTTVFLGAELGALCLMCWSKERPFSRLHRDTVLSVYHTTRITRILTHWHQKCTVLFCLCFRILWKTEISVTVAITEYMTTYSQFLWPASEFFSLLFCLKREGTPPYFCVMFLLYPCRRKIERVTIGGWITV